MRWATGESEWLYRPHTADAPQHHCDPPNRIGRGFTMVDEPWAIPVGSFYLGGLWRCECGQEWHVEHRGDREVCWWFPVSHRRAGRILRRTIKANR